MKYYDVIFILSAIFFNGIQFILYGLAIAKGLAILKRKASYKNNIILCNEKDCEDYLPTISIIKPITLDSAKGKILIEDYFKIDYPYYDIHFCFQSDTNSTIQFVKQMMEKFPLVDVKIHTNHIASVVGNKKIQNITDACNEAKGEFLWIVDENIRIGPNNLRDMITLFDADDVGCVHQIPIYKYNQKFADALNMVYFSAQHARFYIFCDIFNILCVAGMSMLFDKAKLQEIGGIESFGKFLSEDYQLIHEMKYRGYRIRVSPSVALQDPPEATVDGFIKRMTRWHKLRFMLLPVTTLIEPMSHPLMVSLLNSLLLSFYFNTPILLFLGIFLLLFLLMDIILQKTISLAFPEQGSLPPILSYIKAWLFYNIFLVPYLFFKVLKNPKLIQWHSHYYNITWRTIITKDSSEHKDKPIDERIIKRYKRFRELQI